MSARPTPPPSSRSVRALRASAGRPGTVAAPFRPDGADGSAGRDRGIDVLRVLAATGVVGGHWLVTGLVAGADGAWRQASPLTAMPALAPATWVLQTLGLFFFTGGFATARSHARRATPPPNPAGPAALTARQAGLAIPRPHPADTDTPPASPAGPAAPSSRRVRPSGMARLLRGVTALLAFWAAALSIAAIAGVPAGTLRTVAVLVVSPLWFLLPYLLLRAGTAPLIRLVDRAGPAIALPAVAVVAACDAGLLPPWCAVPTAWSVPWVLGVAVARGRPPAGLPLLLTGAAAMAVLIAVVGYPASAVGVPGDGRSNLAPPSLLAVALAAAQIGAFLLLRHRRTKRPRPDRHTRASLERAALPIYLAHQSVLIVVVAASAALPGPPVPGLFTAPADPSWIVHRAAWLPFLALALAAVTRPRWRTPRRARAT